MQKPEGGEIQRIEAVLTAPAFRRFDRNGLVHDGRGAIVAQIDDDGKPVAYSFFFGCRAVALLDARDGTITLEPGALAYLRRKALEAMSEPYDDLDDDPFADEHEESLCDERDREYFERGRSPQA